MDLTYIKNKLENIKNDMINFIPNLLVSILIFILFYVIANCVKNLMSNDSKQNNIYKLGAEIEAEVEIDFESEQTSSQILTQMNKNLIFYQLSIIVYYGIITMGVIFALVHLGFNIGTVLAVLGSLGLALGLALQETLKNIISGPKKCIKLI